MTNRPHTRPSRRAVLSLLGASGLALGLPAQTGAQQVSVLRPRIEEAIRSITTQAGSFVQIDTVSGYGESGQFLISRPGRLRFEYSLRPEVLIADGQHVARVNTDTGAVSRVRLRATPLRVILSDEVDLTDGVTITTMEQTPDSLFVTMYETSRRENGLITVFLDSETFDLRGWKIDEDDGTSTTIILQDTQRGIPIDPNLFNIPD